MTSIWILRTSLALLCLTLCSCVSVPNYQSNAGSKPLFLAAANFKYGKYCGAGHPAFEIESGSQERKEALVSVWPPVDDVDLMCYLHDMCYEEAGSHNQICDQALGATAVSYAEGFAKESGCNNLSKLIGAVGAKFWGKEKNRAASAGIVVANMVWTLPLGLTYYALNFSAYNKYGLPTVQGKCFLNDKKKLHTYILVSDFEAQYREYAKGFKFFTRSNPGKSVVSFVIPIQEWENSLSVFETQKYLNYFGYDAGPADATFDERTAKAVGMFQQRNSMVFGSQSLRPVLELLKSNYLNRSFFERMKVNMLEWEQMKSRYGYTE